MPLPENRANAGAGTFDAYIFSHDLVECTPRRGRSMRSCSMEDHASKVAREVRHSRQTSRSYHTFSFDSLQRLLRAAQLGDIPTIGEFGQTNDISKPLPLLFGFAVVPPSVVHFSCIAVFGSLKGN